MLHEPQDPWCRCDACKADDNDADLGVLTVEELRSLRDRVLARLRDLEPKVLEGYCMCCACKKRWPLRLQACCKDPAIVVELCPGNVG